MEVSTKDAVSTFTRRLDELVSDFKQQVVSYPCNSQALSFAVAAGLPPRMAYTFSETSRYTGVDVKTLYEEERSGRLHSVTPRGQVKGKRIMVTEMDRWFNENTN